MCIWRQDTSSGLICFILRCHVAAWTTEGAYVKMSMSFTYFQWAWADLVKKCQDFSFSFCIDIVLTRNGVPFCPFSDLMYNPSRVSTTVSLFISGMLYSIKGINLRFHRRYCDCDGNASSKWSNIYLYFLWILLFLCIDLELLSLPIDYNSFVEVDEPMPFWILAILLVFEFAAV